MTLNSTDLNLLVALRALLEEGNVTHAGARVALSQPTMSGVLSRLRRHYKDDLLVRVGRDYELTPLAKALLPDVQETLRTVQLALSLSWAFAPATSDRLFTMALSDYAVSVLSQPLLGLVHELAPEAGLDLTPISTDAFLSDRGLLTYDFVIGPHGYGFRGESEVLFRDRFVCVVDPDNARLRDGRLSMDDLAALPHAVAVVGDDLTLADRILDQLGVRRQIQVSTAGWLSLPFVIAGTDLVAVLPERLARRAAECARVLVVEPPFGQAELIEAMWWHPSRATDAGHEWLLTVLREVAAGL